ncbi:MAG: hypothetical protein ABIH08_06295 [Candidatus Omnitrophota bacterium]
MLKKLNINNIIALDLFAQHNSMNSINNNWKHFIQEQAIDYSFELGYVTKRLRILLIRYREQIKNTLFPPESPKFKQELSTFLASKLNEMPDLTLENKVFKKLNKVLTHFLICSLAGNRTADEIILGLQSDIEMRDEVVSLLIKKINSKASVDTQRVFLDQILLGDEELKKLLNQQTIIKGFPHTI